MCSNVDNDNNSNNNNKYVLIQLAVAVQPGVDPNSGQWPADGEYLKLLKIILFSYLHNILVKTKMCHFFAACFFAIPPFTRED